MDWPRTCYVPKDDLELLILIVSTSRKLECQVLGVELKASGTLANHSAHQAVARVLYRLLEHNMKVEESS